MSTLKVVFYVFYIFIIFLKKLNQNQAQLEFNCEIYLFDLNLKKENNKNYLQLTTNNIKCEFSQFPNNLITIILLKKH